LIHEKSRQVFLNIFPFPGQICRFLREWFFSMTSLSGRNRILTRKPLKIVEASAVLCYRSGDPSSTRHENIFPPIKLAANSVRADGTILGVPTSTISCSLTGYDPPIQASFDHESPKSVTLSCCCISFQGFSKLTANFYIQSAIIQQHCGC
jgi:hypothetical protein